MPRSAARRALGPALVLVASLLLGSWSVLTGWLRAINSDALVPIFAGLYRWTPFYWGQSRYGLAVPLFATPIENPILALVFQYVLNHALYLMFWVALAAFLLGADLAVAAGLTAATTAVLFFPAYRIEFIANSQPYFQSGLAALVALELLDRRRGFGTAPAWLLLAVAFWIAPTTLFWIVPLYILREVPPGAGLEAGVVLRQRLLRSVAIGLLAVAVANLGRFVPDVDQTPTSIAPPSAWIGCWRALAASLWEHTQARTLLAGSIAAATALSILLRARRGSLGRGAVPRLLVAAAASFLATGTLAWVVEMAPQGPGGFRYALTSQHLLLAVVPFALFEIGADWLRLRLPAAAMAMAAFALFALVLAVRFGRPSIARAKSSLALCSRQNLHLDPAAHELLDRHATHLLGDYWHVYPFVFRANSIAYESGERRILWPIADRAISARALWWRDDWRTARIAVLKGDTAVATVLRQFGLPELELVESGTTLDIYRGRVASLSAAAPEP